MQRAHELKEAGTFIELYPMTPPDEAFDMTFWSEVLEQPDADPWEDANNVERLQASLWLPCRNLACSTFGFCSTLACTLLVHSNLIVCRLSSQRLLCRDTWADCTDC